MFIFFIIKWTSTILLMPTLYFNPYSFRRETYVHVFDLLQKIVPVSVYLYVYLWSRAATCCEREIYWKPGKPIRTSLYQYPADNMGSVTAWRSLHNTVVTPQWLYQWKRRKKKDCPWFTCVSGTLKHMFLEWLRATHLRDHLSQTLEYLLGTH